MGKPFDRRGMAEAGGCEGSMVSVGTLMLVYVVAWATSVYALTTMSLGR